MRISERGQITIPKRLRERFGMNQGVEVEITAAEDGLLIQKHPVTQHPVESLFGILQQSGNTDQYLELIRGR